MQDIIRFGLRPGPVHIDEDHPSPDTTHHQRIRRSRADKSTSHDSCLHCVIFVS
jgi:hypothetical protein